MSEKTPNRDMFHFYQCVINPNHNIQCYKINDDYYNAKENSRLISVRNIFPKYLHPFIIRYKMNPGYVFID